MDGASSTNSALSGNSNKSASGSSADSANDNSIGSTPTENLTTTQTTAEALASRPTTADRLSGQNDDFDSRTPEAALLAGTQAFGVATPLLSPTPLSATDSYCSPLDSSLLNSTDTLSSQFFAQRSAQTESSTELNVSTGIGSLTDAYSSYQQDGDTAQFQQAASATSVEARQQFIELLAPQTTTQTPQNINPQAHAINVVLRTLPEASFVASMDDLSSAQRNAVLADYVDVSVRHHSRRGTVTSHSPGGLIQKIGEVSDADTRAALFSQQLTQLNTQPQHATSAANAIVNQLDARTFELLSKPANETLALSIANSSAGVISNALSRLGGPVPSVNHSLFARTIFSRLNSDTLTVSQPRRPTENNHTLQSELASALAYKPGQTSVQTEQNAQVIQGLLSSASGREFLAGDGISGPDRMFALEVATDHPELLTPDENVEDPDTPLWETSGISKLYASEAFTRFHNRGNVALSVSGGNIDNYLGASLGLSPTNASNAEQMLRQGQSIFENNEIIEPIADEIRDLQASLFDNQPVSISTVPILYTNANSGPVQLQVYRVEGNGATRFVDNLGRSYNSVQSWKDNNQLPAGQVTYSENLEAGGELVSEATHKTVDTLGERILSVADTAALVGGVVASGVIIAASGGTATPLVAGAWAVAGGTAAYTGIRAGSELADRAEFGQTLNPMNDAGARAAWLSLGASALTVGGGGLARLSTVAESGSTAAAVAGRTGAVLNTGANYVDAAATADSAHGVINNWDQLSSSERAQGILEVAFWGGMTGASARASGGNLSDAFNARIQLAQADIASGRAVGENPALTDGTVSVVHSTDAAGNRTIEVQHAPDATPAEIDIHTNVARELASNQALNGSAYRTLTGEHRFMPGTRGEEVHFEVSKHELLVEHYESAVSAGADELAPRLEELRLDQAVYREVQSAHQRNPDLAAADGIGEIDASPRFAPNKAHVTSTEAREAFEPVDGKFDSFDSYKIAVRADWRPLANTTYELEGIKVTTDQLGRPQLVAGTVDPDRAVGRIARVDTALGNQPGAMDTDIGFHLGADQLGFMGGPLNLVPGDRTLNNSDYKILENELRDFHEIGYTVDVEFKAIYNPGNVSQRPDGFEVRYSLDGVSMDVVFFTNDGTNK